MRWGPRPPSQSRPGVQMLNVPPSCRAPSPPLTPLPVCSPKPGHARFGGCRSSRSKPSSVLCPFCKQASSSAWRLLNIRVTRIAWSTGDQQLPPLRPPLCLQTSQGSATAYPWVWGHGIRQPPGRPVQPAAQEGGAGGRGRSGWLESPGGSETPASARGPVRRGLSSRARQPRGHSGPPSDVFVPQDKLHIRPGMRAAARPRSPFCQSISHVVAVSPEGPRVP